MFKNSEGYADPTAGAAYRNITREDREKARAEESERLERVSALIPVLKAVAAMMGFEVVGRIVLRDMKTGKEYR